jgi:hypothetical protein
LSLKVPTTEVRHARLRTADGSAGMIITECKREIEESEDCRRNGTF